MHLVKKLNALLKAKTSDPGRFPCIISKDCVTKEFLDYLYCKCATISVIVVHSDSYMYYERDLLSSWRFLLFCFIFLKLILAASAIVSPSLS